MLNNIKSKIRNQISTELLKIGSFSIVSTLIKLTLALVIVKISAVYIGRLHFSIVFQFSNVITIFSIASIAALDVGIVRLVAESSHSHEKLEQIRKLITLIILLFSVLISSILFFFSGFWSLQFFNSLDYIIYFKSLALFVFFFAFNKGYLAYNNGLKKYKFFYKVDIFNNITSIVFFTTGTIFFGLTGAIASFLLTPCFTFGMIIFLMRKETVHFDAARRNWWKYERLTLTWEFVKNIFKNPQQFHILKTLFSFSILVLVSSLMGPYVETFIRKALIIKFSSNFSALWDALNKFTGFFIIFFSTLISTYFIPHFVQLKDISKVIQEIKKSMFIIVPAFLIIALIIFVLRNIIILILFSKEFSPLSNLIGIQLLGTLVSIVNILFQTLLVSKANPLILIPYNVIIYISNYYLVIYGAQLLGNYGLPIAYLLNSILGFIFLFVIFKISFFKFSIKKK